nr:MAG TPA: hypothetical protein [Caudoviricetes sp.]
MTIQPISQPIGLPNPLYIHPSDQNMTQLKKYLQKCRVRFGISAIIYKGT